MNGADSGIRDEGPTAFATLLRRLRTEAGLTQAGLARASGVAERSVSDLERGVNKTARNETARLLANALGLIGSSRMAFLASARGEASAAETGIGWAPVKRTLPRDAASFTGRGSELQGLVGPVVVAAGTGAAAGVYSIGGMAGIGKTTFAVHAAHLLKPQFPDGQLFVALHGHTPGLRPMDPADALAVLLKAIGIPPAQIPSNVEERAGYWRDRVAGKRLLLVLDDAASSDQVRPLLPSARRSLVLVTSRRHLTALEDARLISLEILTADEAAALLAGLADRPGIDAGDPAVGQIARLCGYLPLAIGLLARQLHHHPVWTAAGLAADLSAAHDRLELMATENRSVAAAFDLSYKDLTEPQRRLFRHLGLHPGSDIDVRAAAALDGVSLRDARTRLTALFDHYLLAEPAAGRYRLHDLIREHARVLGREDPAGERAQATRRLLDYYQEAAEASHEFLARYPRPGRPAAAVPNPAVRWQDPAQAVAWARAERANLIACLDLATDAGDHARVAVFTSAVAAVLRNEGPWAEAVRRHTVALDAARRLGDRLAEANALDDLGVLRYLTGDGPGAAEAVQNALAVYRGLGDRVGEANALTHLATGRLATGDYRRAAEALDAAQLIYGDLGSRRGQAAALLLRGSLCYLTARYAEALEALLAALEGYRELGYREGQAAALNNVGNVRRLTGDYAGAGDVLQNALSVYQDLGDREGEANVLTNLGSVWRKTGEFEAGTRALENALDIYRDLGDRQGEANALNFLGAVRRLTADYPGAADALQAALGIYRDLGDKGGEVEAVNQVGELHRVRGEAADAARCHAQALNLAREISSSWDEAHALAGLARCDVANGQVEAGRSRLHEAQQIFQKIGAAEAGEIAAELDGLAATD